MITKLIDYVFYLRSLLGLYLLAVVSLWLLPSPIRLFWLYTPFGFQVALYMLGVLIVVVPLVCWLITYFLPPSTQSDS